MVELKVRKVGNSLGVILPRKVIARLNTEGGAVLDLTKVPERGYCLVPMTRSSGQRWPGQGTSCVATATPSMHVLAR